VVYLAEMTPPDEDFAALFEKSLKVKPVRRGETIEGTIVAINAKGAFVDVGGKGEALIDIAELKDEAGAIQARVGDRIHAVVTSTEGGLTLSHRLARGAATNRQLEDAYRSGLTVEGKVEREVKGGYEVRIGGSRAFCPFSQIDLRRGSGPHPGSVAGGGPSPRSASPPGAPAPRQDGDTTAHIGRVYEFRITEYAEGGRNIVVSRRALLEEQQEAAAAEVRRSIAVDAVIAGRVASVRDFGAFVDLGAGVQGLLHASEMGWSRVVPSQVVETGQQITVKVLRVEEDGKKIALGLKQLLADPWTKVPATYEVGQVRSGRVTRLADFGAFVELEPGIEALAHVSTFEAAGYAKDWKKTGAVGTTAPFEIVSIDVDKRRIGLKPVPEGSARSIAGGNDERDDAAAALPAAPERLGSLADQLKKLIPILLAAVLGLAQTTASAGLRIYVIDVEGGGATLVIAPSRQAMLIDSGSPGAAAERDSKRIADAMQAAGLTKIDYLFTTHYDGDHIGGAPAANAVAHFDRFFDHGDMDPRWETNATGGARWDAYKAVAAGRRTVVNAGDTIPLAGVRVDVVSSHGEVIGKSINGGGAKNPYCNVADAKPPNTTENSQCAGVLVSYRGFTFLDVGDLTWDKETDLACPVNRLGRVSLLLATHHGFFNDQSGAPALLWAIRPQVVIANNGPRKGMAASAFERIQKIEDLEGLWQSHLALATDAAHNTSDDLIANTEASADCKGHWIRIDVGGNRTYTVTNGRNNVSRSYRVRQ